MHFPCILHAFFFSNIFTHFLHELEIVGAPQGPEGGPESTISNSCKKCVNILEKNEKCMQNTWKMHDMYDFMTVGSIILSSVCALKSTVQRLYVVVVYMYIYPPPRFARGVCVRVRDQTSNVHVPALRFTLYALRFTFPSLPFKLV